MRKCPKNPPQGVLGGVVRSWSWPKKGSKSITFNFLPKKIIGENDVLGIIWRRSPQREARLRLGSVAEALVDSPQHPVDSS